MYTIELYRYFKIPMDVGLREERERSEGSEAGRATSGGWSAAGAGA
jgi:hypothetical protein